MSEKLYSSTDRSWIVSFSSGSGALPWPLLFRVHALLQGLPGLVGARDAVFCRWGSGDPLLVRLAEASVRSVPWEGDWSAPLQEKYRRGATILPSSRREGLLFLTADPRALVSIHWIGHGWAEYLRVCRAGMDAPFTCQELALIDRVHRTPLCSSASEAAYPKLAPREQEVLEGLLAGGSEKEVAVRLGLSPHTVHIYVKNLYRRFGVCSRAELMSRCLIGSAPAAAPESQEALPAGTPRPSAAMRLRIRRATSAFSSSG